MSQRIIEELDAGLFVVAVTVAGQVLRFWGSFVSKLEAEAAIGDAAYLWDDQNEPVIL